MNIFSSFCKLLKLPSFWESKAITGTSRLSAAEDNLENFANWMVHYLSFKRLDIKGSLRFESHQAITGIFFFLYAPLEKNLAYHSRMGGKKIVS